MVLCILYSAMGDFQLNVTCPLIRTFLRQGTDGLYCVTKGVSLFLSPCSFCGSASEFNFCEDVNYQIIWLSSNTQV